MTGVHDTFWPGVLTGIAAPVTPWNCTSFDNWASHEGNESHRFWINNPFASTQNGNLDTSFNIGFGPGIWNSTGVKVYADQASGIAATIATITNGNYPNIIRCFRDQYPYPEAARDFYIWIHGPYAAPGLDNYGIDVLGFMYRNTASKQVAAPEITLADVVRALTGREGALAAERLAKWNKRPDGTNRDNSLLDGYEIQGGNIAANAAAILALQRANGGLTDAVIASLEEIIRLAKKGQGGSP